MAKALLYSKPTCWNAFDLTVTPSLVDTRLVGTRTERGLTDSCLFVWGLLITARNYRYSDYVRGVAAQKEMGVGQVMVKV